MLIWSLTGHSFANQPGRMNSLVGNNWASIRTELNDNESMQQLTGAYLIDANEWEWLTGWRRSRRTATASGADGSINPPSRTTTHRSREEPGMRAAKRRVSPIACDSWPRPRKAGRSASTRHRPRTPTGSPWPVKWVRAPFESAAGSDSVSSTGCNFHVVCNFHVDALGKKLPEFDPSDPALLVPLAPKKVTPKPMAFLSANGNSSANYLKNPQRSWPVETRAGFLTGIEKNLKNCHQFD